jgi:PAS domain S-box-containing protein
VGEVREGAEINTDSLIPNSGLFSSDVLRRNDGFLNILHVDDDPNQVDMLRLFFYRLDESITVQGCSDPFDAVKLIASNGFDCIVSDYVMPGMNGVELVERVKELKDIPFIIYTGQGSEEVAQLAFRAGADDYIRKEIEPSHYEVLINSIRHSVDKHRAEQIYRVVFETNPEAIIVTIDNVIEYSNLASASLFGVVDRGELVGRCFTDFLLDHDSEEISWLFLQRIVSERRTIPFELTLQTNVGDKKMVEGTLQNMYFFGKPAQFYFIRDITEKREMERGLMYTQYQFDRVLDHSLIGIGLINQNYRIERCNLLFKRFFGLNLDCTEFRLLDEPSILKKINNRLLPNDSVHFDLSLDFHGLTEKGYLVSQNDEVGRVEMIVSPISLETDGHGFLVQVQEYC